MYPHPLAAAARKDADHLGSFFVFFSSARTEQSTTADDILLAESASTFTTALDLFAFLSRDLQLIFVSPNPDSKEHRLRWE